MYNLEIFRVFQKVILDQAIELNFFSQTYLKYFPSNTNDIKNKSFSFKG